MISDVSVIIPCYQAASTIRRCVESVMCQRALPREVILVNDGSTDDTEAVLLALQEAWQQHFEIKVISLNKNQGVAAARNAGWAVAKGKLLAFLDADDSWHPEKLSIQAEWMHANPEVDLSCHAISTKPVLSPFKLVSRQVSKKSLLFKNKVLTSTVMLKREVPLRFNALQRYSEDYQLWLRLAFSGFSIAYLEAPMTMRFKAAYGERGLSQNLWAMQFAELGNYRALWKQGYISVFLYLGACFFSAIKFIKRLFIYFYKRSGN